MTGPGTPAAPAWLSAVIVARMALSLSTHRAPLLSSRPLAEYISAGQVAYGENFGAVAPRPGAQPIQ